MYINFYQLAANPFGHTRAARDQHMRGAVGADADSDAFAHGPMGFNALRVHVCGQGAVDSLGDVLQRQLAQCDQVAAAKEVGQSLLGAIDPIDIASSHAGL